MGIINDGGGSIGRNLYGIAGFDDTRNVFVCNSVSRVSKGGIRRDGSSDGKPAVPDGISIACLLYTSDAADEMRSV